MHSFVLRLHALRYQKAYKLGTVLFSRTKLIWSLGGEQQFGRIMVSVRVLLYAKWGYFLQINGQQNICGVRTSDEHCGKKNAFGHFFSASLQTAQHRSWAIQTTAPFASSCCPNSPTITTQSYHKNCKSLFSTPVLEIKTTDFGKVTIRGLTANVYVAMNAQGNLCATVSTLIKTQL